jgi:copper resistance protein B
MKKLLLNTALIIGLGTSAYAGGGGDILRASVMVDNLEYQYTDTKTISWDAFGYVGYDTNKVYIYSEGEKEDGASESESENQLVYSRAIAPYWDVQFGLGYDTAEGNDNTWGVVALSGLAPYFFETRAALLVDGNGNIGFRAEAEYEALFTQKLILTPSIAISAYTKDDLEMGLGSGLSNLNIGARLRYEFTRKFAPYIGVEWTKNFGKTDELSHVDDTYVVAGLRFWF